MLCDNFAHRTQINQSEFIFRSQIYMPSILGFFNYLNFFINPILQLVKLAGRNAMVAAYVRFIAGSSHCSVRD